MTESAIEGWDQIAAMFNVSTRTVQRRKEELERAGAIFYRWKSSKGRKVRVVCAFPSSLRTWMAEKSKKGEPF